LLVVSVATVVLSLLSLPSPPLPPLSLLVLRALCFARHSSSDAHLAANSPSRTMADLADASLPAYESASALRSDIEALWANGHPYEKLRNEVVPPDSESNYYEFLRRNLQPYLPAARGFEPCLPDQLFDDMEADCPLPLTYVGFRAETLLPNAQPMTTTWRAHSKIRVMNVVRRLLEGKQGLNTKRERLWLVAHESMKGADADDLRFGLPHGIGSTRLMSAHVRASDSLFLFRARRARSDREIC